MQPRRIEGKLNSWWDELHFQFLLFKSDKGQRASRSLQTLYRGKQQFLKTGSLCCVAARPHGSTISNDGWSTAAHEPQWRSNGGYSPPLSSTRWDSKVQPEDLATTSRTYQQHRTSFSSSSRGSRSGSRIGSARFVGHQRTLSGGLFLNGESPSDSFRTNVWNPLASSSEHLGDLVAAVSGVSQCPCFMLFHLCFVMASLLSSRI